MKHLARVGLALLLIAGVSGCTSYNSSSSVTQPSPNSTLTGGWVGTLTDASNQPRQATWSATQTGNTVGGPLVAFVGPSTSAVTFTLVGTTSGVQTALTLTLTLQSGNCSASGMGTSSASRTPMSASINMTFTTPCIPNISGTAKQTYQLVLTKS